MKRSLASAGGVAVLLASAVGAQAVANIDSGKYKGKIGKHTPVQLKVTSSKKLVHFKFKRLTTKCTDGDHFTPKDKKGRYITFDSGSKKLTILDNGKFAFTVTYTNGGKW